MGCGEVEDVAEEEAEEAEGAAEEVESGAEDVEGAAEEVEGGVEEEGERRETPNEGNPVCRFWRRQRQRDWAIAVVSLKRNKGWNKMSNVYFRYIIDQVHKKHNLKNPISDGCSRVPWY